MDRTSATDSTGLGCFIVSVLLFGGLIGLSIPSFFNQADLARESEGRQYVGSLNRAQQAYYLDEQKFSENIPDLGLGIQTETSNYFYSIEITDDAVFNYGIARNKDTYSYVGAVVTLPLTEVNSDAVSDEITTVAILCQANTLGSIKPPAPTYQNGKFTCTQGTTDLSR